MKTVGEANVRVSYQNQDPKSYGGARQWSCTTGQKLATTFCFRLVKMVIREKAALQQLLCAFFNLFNDELETISLGKAKLAWPSHPLTHPS